MAISNFAQLCNAVAGGDWRAAASALRLLAPAASEVPVIVGADVTISKTNAETYNGKTLNFSTAATLTLTTGLPPGFGFAVIPPAAGNASIAVSGAVTINGAGVTLTRDAAGNIIFAVVQSGPNAYVGSGA